MTVVSTARTTSARMSVLASTRGTGIGMLLFVPPVTGYFERRIPTTRRTSVR